MEVVRLNQLLRLVGSQEERVADRLAKADPLVGSDSFSYYLAPCNDAAQKQWADQQHPFR